MALRCRPAPVVEVKATVPAPLLVGKEVPVWQEYKTGTKDGKPAGTLRDVVRYANDSNAAAQQCEDDRARVKETQK